MTAAEWIDANGGPAAIARATGYKPGAVALWRHRNKIPRAAWPEIMDAFPAASIVVLKAIEAASVSRDSGGAQEAAA